MIAFGLLMKLAVETKASMMLDILALLLSVVAATLISRISWCIRFRVSQRREYDKALRKERHLHRQAQTMRGLFGDNIRKVRHDLKNHLSVVSAKLNSGDPDGCNEYINTLTETVKQVRKHNKHKQFGY